MESRERAGEHGRKGDRKRKHIIKEEPEVPHVGPRPYMAPPVTKVAFPVPGLTGMGRAPWAWQAQPDWCAYLLCRDPATPILLPLLHSPLVAQWLPGTQPGHIASP